MHDIKSATLLLIVYDCSFHILYIVKETLNMSLDSGEISIIKYLN